MQNGKSVTNPAKPEEKPIPIALAQALGIQPVKISGVFEDPEATADGLSFTFELLNGERVIVFCAMSIQDLLAQGRKVRDAGGQPMTLNLSLPPT